MNDFTVTFDCGELIALLKCLNVILPEVGNLVKEGELGFYEAVIACNAFDELCDSVTETLGSDAWLGEAA